MKDLSLYTGMLTVLLAGLGHWGKTKENQKTFSLEEDKFSVTRFAATWGYAGAFFSCLATIVFAMASQIQ